MRFLRFCTLSVACLLASEAEAQAEQPPTTLAVVPRAAPTVTVTKTKTTTKTIAKTTKTTTKTLTKVTVTTKVTSTTTSVRTSTITRPAETSTVTRPASTITATTTVEVTAPPSTTTVTSTVTTQRPVVNGPPGYRNVENSLFENGNGSTDWCRTREAGTCEIVQRSNDDSFSGAFGPGMLKVSEDNASLIDLAYPVPVVQYPNPSGRDWVVTALFRADSESAGQCWPQLEWAKADGSERWLSAADLSPGDRWQAVSRTLPGSAGGAGEAWVIYVYVLCRPPSAGKFLYVDGVAIN